MRGSDRRLQHEARQRQLQPPHASLLVASSPSEGCTTTRRAASVDDEVGGGCARRMSAGSELSLSPGAQLNTHHISSIGLHRRPAMMRGMGEPAES